MDGTHRHKCGNCNHIWRHSNQCAGNKDAHTCEKCGEPQWDRYYEDVGKATTADEIRAALAVLLSGVFFR